MKHSKNYYKITGPCLNLKEWLYNNKALSQKPYDKNKQERDIMLVVNNHCIIMTYLSQGKILRENIEISIHN